MFEQLAVPARAVGGFFEMTIDTFREMFHRPFQLREFLDQTWMIARVSMIPTLLVSIPFTVLVAFTLNILLREIGAADLSGAGTAFGTITQLGPVVTVLVIAGAGAIWVLAQTMIPQLGIPLRYAVLIDLFTLAAFIWALIVIFRMWRQRRQS